MPCCGTGTKCCCAAGERNELSVLLDEAVKRMEALEAAGRQRGEDTALMQGQVRQMIASHTVMRCWGGGGGMHDSMAGRVKQDTLAAIRGSTQAWDQMHAGRQSEGN